MSLHSVIYSGEQILRTVSAPTEELIALNCSEDEQYLLTENPVDPEEYWVSVDVLTNKFPFSGLQVALQAQIGDTVFIKKIPEGTTIVWPDGFTSVEYDGEISTTAVTAYPMVFCLSHPRFLTEEVTINVSP